MVSKSKPHVLYIATQALDFFTSAVIRAMLYSFITSIVLLPALAALSLSNSFFLSLFLFIIIALIFLGGFLVIFVPLAISVYTYLGYGGGHLLTRHKLGAREPSTREREKFIWVLKVITSAAGDAEVKGLSGFYIIDAPTEYMYLVGTTLYMSSGVIRSQYFQTMLAHEIGHLQNGDGVTILALRRLVLPIIYTFIADVRDFSTSRPASRRAVAERPKPDIRPPELEDLDFEEKPEGAFFSIFKTIFFFLFSLVGGGFGVWLTSGFWARYFRERDYLADEFVIACGLKDELLDYLEKTKFFDTSVPFMVGWEPVNEQRIDRILNSS